ncbi:putative Gas41 [Besnoitia besnoiti]|uniref:Putative Gas41 n=1 Tax=Besnoitia besnoiti TaxID=94643 RepID=A0A2A9MID1_BESBE|nr:putative Gas41 [Besnoitia besnoiti]PFH36964.1 putative Gas41 [Besnoitia besnoiti]
MPRDRSGSGAAPAFAWGDDREALAATGVALVAGGAAHPLGWQEASQAPPSHASSGPREKARAHHSRHAGAEGSGARLLKGLTVRKTFVLGSYAFRLSPTEKKKYNDMTHKWTCLLRALNGEDLTYCVKKVVFELDPSFVNPKRTLSSPPYEVSEAGWGEFQICVKVYFLDESLPPAELRHFLRLNPDGGQVVGPCVASETLDEVLIHEPKESFYDVLMEGPHRPAAPHPLERYFLQHQPRFDEQMKLLMGAQGFVQSESMNLMAEAFALTNQIRQLQAACDPRVYQHLQSQNQASLAAPASAAASQAAFPAPGVVQASQAPPSAVGGGSPAPGTGHKDPAAFPPQGSAQQDVFLSAPHAHAPQAAPRGGTNPAAAVAGASAAPAAPHPAFGGAPAQTDPHAAPAAAGATPGGAQPGSGAPSAAMAFPGGATQTFDSGVSPPSSAPHTGAGTPVPASGAAPAVPGAAGVPGPSGSAGASPGPMAGPGGVGSLAPAMAAPGAYALVSGHAALFGAAGGGEKPPGFDQQALHQQMLLQQQQALMHQQHLYHAQQQQQYIMQTAGVFSAYPGETKREPGGAPGVAQMPAPSAPAPFAQAPGGGAYPASGGVAVQPGPAGLAFPGRMGETAGRHDLGAEGGGAHAMGGGHLQPKA